MRPLHKYEAPSWEMVEWDKTGSDTAKDVNKTLGYET